MEKTKNNLDFAIKIRTKDFKIKNYENLNERYGTYNEENNIEVKQKKREQQNKYFTIFNKTVQKINEFLSIENQEIDLSDLTKVNFDESKIEKDNLSDNLYKLINELSQSENDVDITLIKNESENNLVQYFLKLGFIELSLEIIKTHFKVIFEINKDLNKFNKFLLNNNKKIENLFEIAVQEIKDSKKVIKFFKNLFDFLEKNNDKIIFTKLLKKREDNIFHFCIKIENIFLLLYLY